MSQAWAKSFYNSKAWIDCRLAYISSVHGLCERCSERGYVIPGYIVHHKVWLNANNINDPNVSLNHDHLRYECLECHNATHSNQVHGVTREGLAFDLDGNIIEVSGSSGVSPHKKT